MANSSTLAYYQNQVLDQSGVGAGQQWLHALFLLYRYFFTVAHGVDSARFRRVDSSLTTAQWGALAAVVDNTWFVVEATKGKQVWQAKFQATNVAPLDEAPGITYCLACSLSPGAGWTAKGDPNGGFAASAVVASANLMLGGTDVTGANGTLFVHGDRDTVLIAMATHGAAAYNTGAYVGRFEPESDRIPYPSVLLTAWDGVGAFTGFDRTGCFALTPSDSFLLSSATPPVSTNGFVFTSQWLVTSTQPSAFSGEYTYRPIELCMMDAFVGYLRLVWGCAGLAALSRLDSRQKLVLHGGDLDAGVAISHNGLVF